jgi:hypothetical protein
MALLLNEASPESERKSEEERWNKFKRELRTGVQGLNEEL